MAYADWFEFEEPASSGGSVFDFLGLGSILGAGERVAHSYFDYKGGAAKQFYDTYGKTIQAEQIANIKFSNAALRGGVFVDSQGRFFQPNVRSPGLFGSLPGWAPWALGGAAVLGLVFFLKRR